MPRPHLDDPQDSHHEINLPGSKPEDHTPPHKGSLPGTDNLIPEDSTPPQPGCLPGPLPDDGQSHDPFFEDQIIGKLASRITKAWPIPTQSAFHEFPEFCDLYMKIKQWNLPNFLGARIPLKSDLIIPAWESYLTNYHDKLLCQFLNYGWPVGYNSDTPPRSVDENHQSARKNLSHVKKFVNTELAHNALVGPFKSQPFTPWCRVSPLMTRDKKDSHEKRIIVDLSFPANASVNAAIDPTNHLGKNVTYTLPTIADLVAQLQRYGNGAYFWKADLSRAYRQLRVDPLDTPLLAIQVEAELYLDLCPPFGCRTSAALCQRVANAITYILGKEEHHVLAYLDDYGACHPSHQTATIAYKRFKQLAAELGLQLADHKSLPPATSMEWLGYVVDSTEMSVTIPQAKLQEVLQECQVWLSRSRASKKMIQKIVGKLIFISNCVHPGRKFVSRILATLSHMGDREWTTISDHFKADVRWFYEYARQANGVYLCSPIKKTYEIECDSSLIAGAGTTNCHYYAWQYTEAHVSRFPQIYQLEAVNLLLAYKTLAPTFQEKPAKVIVWTDNSASSFALQTGRTKDLVLSACARELWLIASRLNHQVEIRHKKGALLPLPDALSRMFHDHEKRKLAFQLISDRDLECVSPVLDNYKFFNSDL